MILDECLDLSEVLRQINFDDDVEELASLFVIDDFNRIDKF